MRLLEASHVVEILREAGPSGLHVGIISERNGVETNKLGQLYNLALERELMQIIILLNSPHSQTLSNTSHTTRGLARRFRS